MISQSQENKAQQSLVFSSREQQVHGTVKAPKGLKAPKAIESVRNNREAKGCILRSCSDMGAVNISGFKTYMKGVRVLR